MFFVVKIYLSQVHVLHANYYDINYVKTRRVINYISCYSNISLQLTTSLTATDNFFHSRAFAALIFITASSLAVLSLCRFNRANAQKDESLVFCDNACFRTRTHKTIQSQPTLICLARFCTLYKCCGCMRVWLMHSSVRPDDVLLAFK